jgi:ribokinase
MHRVATLEKQLLPPAAEDTRPRITVVGSCFIDYVAYVQRIPSPGETLHSESFVKGFGGKGANQAVMAAKLGGCRVSMVAAVGKDGDGQAYVDNFVRAGVDPQHVVQVAGESTGLAMICVDVKAAHNAIVICPNAASKSSPELFFGDQRVSSADPLEGCKILICQNEITLEATLDVLQRAHDRGIYTIFNSAPAPSDSEIVRIKPCLVNVSLICPNEHEAYLMTGVKVVDIPTARAAVKAFRAMGANDVVITLGAMGALVAPFTGTVGAAVHVPAQRVKAVDTTGAGDCFVGTMAHFLALGEPLEAACRKANAVSAISVTRKGTQASYPDRAALPAALFN